MGEKPARGRPSDSIIDITSLKDSSMLRLIDTFRRCESGATMVEYGLLVALIALVVGLGAQIVGTQLSTLFSEIGSYVGTVTVPTV